MNFLKDELIHLTFALTVGVFFYLKRRDWRLILGALIFGFFVDLDHLFDYFLYFGLKFNWFSFLNVGTYMIPSQKIYVFFHGWEFVVPLWLMGKRLGEQWKIKYLAWAVSLAYLSHLFWDNFTVSAHPLAYSFIYRLLNGFSLESFGGF